MSREKGYTEIKEDKGKLFLKEGKVDMYTLNKLSARYPGTPLLIAESGLSVK